MLNVDELAKPTHPCAQDQLERSKILGVLLLMDRLELGFGPIAGTITSKIGRLSDCDFWGLVGVNCRELFLRESGAKFVGMGLRPQPSIYLGHKCCCIKEESLRGFARK